MGFGGQRTLIANHCYFHTPIVQLEMSNASDLNACKTSYNNNKDGESKLNPRLDVEATTGRKRGNGHRAGWNEDGLGGC
jgi:hypothetical protein